MAASVRGIAAGCAIAATLVACAAMPQASRTSSARPSQAPMSIEGRGSAEHDEIDSLWKSIAADREQHGMTEGFEGYAATPFASLAVCTPPHSDKCTDACTVSDSICDNAKKICALADKLPGDAWAAGKCEDGTKSCDQAHAACCDCT